MSPQMWSLTRAPVALTAHDALDPGKIEGLVDARPDEGRRGVPDPDDVRARLYLAGCEQDGEVCDEVEEVMDELLVVHEIHHEPVDAPQVRRFGARTFHPSLDELLFSRCALQAGHGRDDGWPCAFRFPAPAPSAPRAPSSP